MIASVARFVMVALIAACLFGFLVHLLFPQVTDYPRTFSKATEIAVGTAVWISAVACGAIDAMFAKRRRKNHWQILKTKCCGEAAVSGCFYSLQPTAYSLRN